MGGFSAQNCKYNYSRINRRRFQDSRKTWAINCHQDKSIPGPSAELCGLTKTLKHAIFKKEPESDSSDSETSCSSKRASEENEKTSLGKNVAFKKEPESDSSDSETNYVLQMVMDENKLVDKINNEIKKEISSLEYTVLPELSLQCLHEDKTASDQHALNLNASSSLPPVSSSSRRVARKFWTKCCICSKTNVNSDGYRFHRFPKDSKRSREWLRVIGKKHLTLLSTIKLYRSYRVCSLHFEEKAFKSSKKTFLREDAIPSLNLRENGAQVTRPLAMHSPISILSLSSTLKQKLENSVAKENQTVDT